MKQISLLLLITLTTLVGFAQVPNAIEGINYQGIARDENGVVLANEEISVRFIFRSPTNSNLLTEAHVGIETNKFGLFTLIIGSQNPGSLTNTIWKQATKIFIEADLGDGWQNIDEISLTAVPYAFKAKYEGQKLDYNSTSKYLRISDGNKDNNGNPIFIDSTDLSTLTGGGTGTANDWLKPDGTTPSNISDNIYTDGKVGINTGTTPLNAQLEIKSSTQGGNALDINDGGNSLLFVKNNGKIGIGTASPTHNLDVMGKIRMRGGSGTIGYIPVSNANGVMTWTDPNSVFTEVDGSVTNEIQNLLISGNTLSISGGGTGVTLPSGTDDQNISGSGLSGTTLTIGIENGTDETVDLSGLDDKDWLKNSSPNHATSITNNIYTRGNVGIKTNYGDPLQAKLHIVQNNTNPALILGHINQSSKEWKFNVDGSSNFSITKETALVPSFYIKNTGNVGIGTNSPTAKLYISQTNNSNGLVVNCSSTNPNTKIFQASNNSGIGLYVKGNGYVGIGTTSPSNLFSMKTPSTYGGGKYVAIIENTINNGHGLKIITNNTVGKVLSVERTSSSLFMVKGDGKVGIGTSSPSHQLTLSTNNAAKPTSSAWTIISDRRLKTNINPYTSGINDLLKINPVWFTYTGKAGMPKETGVGIIAQDLQKIAPYMVNSWTYENTKEDTKEDYLSVDNGAMTYMLINATKEQQKQIEQQKEQLTKQQLQINLLIEEIEKLKNK